jgi:predicted component of type VI protein secretion system
MLPLVIQIERTDERRADTCAFAQSPVRVGRNPLNDLQLDEGFVSQWHGVIRFDETQTTYLDLGSTNPTLIDGQPVQRNLEIPISETTDLRIGSLRLHLLRVPAADELYGARRKTNFARMGREEEGGVAKTMFLLDLTPPGGAPAVEDPPPRVDSAKPSARPGAAPAPASMRAVASAAPVPSSSVRPIAAQLPSSAAGLDPALHAAYLQFLESRRVLLARVSAELEATASGERESMIARLIGALPELGRETELRAMLAKLGINPLRTGVPEMEDWFRRLTDGLFPPPGVPINVALAMERIGEVLEVFSTAFVELRKAHTDFCAEMALEAPSDSTVLRTTESPRALLAYLLNPGKEGGAKVTELARAMADFAVHQVALVSAVVQGARDVLEELSPETLAGAGETVDKPGFMAKLFGGDKTKLWQRYVAVFAEAVDEDRFTRKLFGRGFARKYYAITGGRRSLVMPPRK